MYFFSSRIQLDWLSLVKEMDAETGHGVCETTTPKEFHRIALAVAYTLSNPCECLFWECVMVFNL